ncbi:MAG: hypothetical protein HY713_12225 [candidate division NC10 bacterium]|nr:hypothetical protein [candidate division NC10 bacterium]
MEGGKVDRGAVRGFVEDGEPLPVEGGEGLGVEAGRDAEDRHGGTAQLGGWQVDVSGMRCLAEEVEQAGLRAER